MNLLLGAGADANTANDFKITPLSEACTNGNSALVRALLKSGANPNTPVATGETPLMTCARPSADAVQVLIEYGATVNAKEPYAESDSADVGCCRAPSRCREGVPSSTRMRIYRQ